MAVLFWLCLTTSWAFVSEGDVLVEWTVTGVQQHPEFLRVALEHPEHGETGVEVIADSSSAGDWNTGRHRLMPAPGQQPPQLLLVACMHVLRQYDAASKPMLALSPGATADDPNPDDGPDILYDGVNVGPDEFSPEGPYRPSVAELAQQALAWTKTAVALVIMLLAALTAAVVRWRPQWIDAARPVARKAAWPALAALVVLLAIPRLVDPGLNTPFFADAMTQRVFIATLDLDTILTRSYPDPRHPQMMYVVLHAVAGVFGTDEIFMRAPAALASLGAAVLLFVMVRETSGTVPAALAVALLGLNVQWLENSREVGDLALFVMFWLAASLALLRCIEEPRAGPVALFVVLELCMVYSWYMSVLVVAAHVVVLAVHCRDREPWIGLAVVGLLSIPFAIDLFELVQHDTGARQTATSFPVHFWGELTSQQLFSRWIKLLAPSGAAALIGAVAAGVGVVRLRGQPLGTLMASLLFGSSVVLAVVVALVRLKPYYMLFLLPAVLVLLAAALAWDDERPSWWRAAGTVAVGLFLLTSSVDHYRQFSGHVTHRGEAPVQAVARIIRTNQTGGEIHIAADPSYFYTIMAYYLAHDDPGPLYRSCEGGGGTRCRAGDVRISTLTSLPEMQEGWEALAVQRYEALDRPLWFLYNHRFPNEPLHDAVQAECNHQRTLDHRGLDLYYCD